MNFNEKQIEILEMVEKLISEYGISGTSIRKIAKESEINIAMVSYYFGSKEKMIESLFQYKSYCFDLYGCIFILGSAFFNLHPGHIIGYKERSRKTSDDFRTLNFFRTF